MSNPQQQWRMFIAIESSPEVQSALKHAQESLRSAVAASAIRWTQPAQFHLTLKFLGNVPVSRVESLTSRLTEACRGFGSLWLRAENIGFFPNARSPRVIWAGVNDEKQRLGELSKLVATTTEEFNREESDHEFHGHITLGRVKRLSRREAARLAQEREGAAKSFGEWDAHTLLLIRSELSSAGSIYTAVAEHSLTY